MQGVEKIFRVVERCSGFLPLTLNRKAESLHTEVERFSTFLTKMDDTGPSVTKGALPTYQMKQSGPKRRRFLNHEKWINISYREALVI